MKTKLIVTAAIAGSLALSGVRAQTDEAKVKLDTLTVTGVQKSLGQEKSFAHFVNVEIKNLQDEPLGRIIDLGVDLINGRIVEALVKSDSSLNVDNQIVAVPPQALIADVANQVYRLNVSQDRFKSAQPIDITKWEDSGRSERVAAAYHLFGQEPYFLEEGAKADPTAARPKVALGYVERANKLLDLPVGNRQGQAFGKVWSLTMNIPQARILSVIILAPGNFKTKSVVPAMALSFNPTRDALVLDDTKLEYEAEPRLVFTEAAFGNPASSREESYKGPRTNVALEQGTSYRDIDRTLLINQNIRAAKINHRHIEVGTLHGRVTLRGWVETVAEKNQIGAIAIAASRVEVVDNQINVGKPAAAR